MVDRRRQAALLEKLYSVISLKKVVAKWGCAGKIAAMNTPTAS